jgi:hypothetical protein
MSDRMKLTLASLTIMMLPYRVGYPLGVLVLTAIVTSAIDLAKERFGRLRVTHNFIWPFLSRALAWF